MASPRQAIWKHGLKCHARHSCKPLRKITDCFSIEPTLTMESPNHFLKAIPDIPNQSGRVRLCCSNKRNHISQWVKTQRCLSCSDYISCTSWPRIHLHTLPLWKSMHRGHTLWNVADCWGCIKKEIIVAICVQALKVHNQMWHSKLSLTFQRSEQRPFLT